MFDKQIILNRGLPFEVKFPTAEPVNAADLTEAELRAELKNSGPMKKSRGTAKDLG